MGFRRVGTSPSLPLVLAALGLLTAGCGVTCEDFGDQLRSQIESAQAGDVAVPAGVYCLTRAATGTASIQVPPGVRVVGSGDGRDGNAATQIRVQADDSPAFLLLRADGAVVTDLRIFNESTAGNGRIGVVLSGTRAAVVERLTLEGMHHTGIQVKDAEEVRIAENIVLQTVAGSGIHVLSAVGSVFEANHVQAAKQDGIKLENGPVIDCRFVANYLSGATRDGLDGAIKFPDCEPIRDNVFAGNIVTDNAYQGLELKVGDTPADEGALCRDKKTIGQNTFRFNVAVRNCGAGLHLQKSRVTPPDPDGTNLEQNLVCGSPAGAVLLNDAQQVLLRNNFLRGTAPLVQADCPPTHGACAEVDGPGAAARLLGSPRSITLIDNSWRPGDCRVPPGECSQLNVSGNVAASDAARDALLADVLAAFPYHLQDNDGDGIANAHEAVFYGTDPNVPTHRPTARADWCATDCSDPDDETR